MENSSLNTEFYNVTLFISGFCSVTGTIKLKKFLVTMALHLKENQTEQSDPFSDDFFALSPLTAPYLSKNGHHVFDLAYFSEITIIESPPRICFHDPSQEPGISLNFATKDDFKSFFMHLRLNLTVGSPGLPGFFQISRFHPPISLATDFEKTKRAAKEKLYVESSDSVSLLEAQNDIIPKITPLSKRTPAKKSELMNIVSNRQDLQKYISTHTVSEDLQIIAWSLLIGLYPYEKIETNVLQAYNKVKSQWNSLTESQMKRSSKFQDNIHYVTSAVQSNMKQMLSIIPDESIATISFNVLMSVGSVYSFIFNQITSIIPLLNVLLKLYVSSISHGKDSNITIHMKDGTSLNSELVEAALFWSFVYIFEVFETRNFLHDSSKCSISATQPLSDLLLLIHPHFYRYLTYKGISNIDSIDSIFAFQFSSYLPINCCIDMWISALASCDPALYFRCVVISGIFFYFPDIPTMPISKEQSLMPIIKHSFDALGYPYLQHAAYALIGKIREIIKLNYPTI